MSIYGDAGRDEDGKRATHLVPTPRAERGAVGRVRLRDHKWGKELREHEARKAAMLRLAAGPGEYTCR